MTKFVEWSRPTPEISGSNHVLFSLCDILGRKGGQEKAQTFNFSFFLKNGPFPASFSLFTSFQYTVDSKQMFSWCVSALKEISSRLLNEQSSLRNISTFTTGDQIEKKQFWLENFRPLSLRRLDSRNFGRRGPPVSGKWHRLHLPRYGHRHTWKFRQ